MHYNGCWHMLWNRQTGTDSKDFVYPHCFSLSSHFLLMLSRRLCPTVPCISLVIGVNTWVWLWLECAHCYTTEIGCTVFEPATRCRQPFENQHSTTIVSTMDISIQSSPVQSSPVHSSSPPVQSSDCRCPSLFPPQQRLIISHRITDK